MKPPSTLWIAFPPPDPAFLTPLPCVSPDNTSVSYPACSSPAQGLFPGNSTSDFSRAQVSVFRNPKDADSIPGLKGTLQLPIHLSNSGTLHVIPSLSSPTEDYGSYPAAGKSSLIPHFIGQRYPCANVPLPSKPPRLGRTLDNYSKDFVRQGQIQGPLRGSISQACPSKEKRKGYQRS